MVELTDDEMMRYNRQIVLRGFDFAGQEKLKASTVLIIGLGGLGCAASQYLTSAGVGTLLLVDFDTVSLSNLQRQILHSDTTVGMLKVDSARQRLAQLNPGTRLFTWCDKMGDEQLLPLIEQSDVVLDCTDNVATRNQLNRLCYSSRTPLVSAAAIRMEGWLTVFTYQEQEACYRCLSRLFADTELTCVEAGVMAPLVGIIGTLQALECIKLLSGYGEVTR
ncbi:MAG: molybdopterin-synthase adenylyltransferase MoeB, partial [Enterobacteriaceae bacterium]